MLPQSSFSVLNKMKKKIVLKEERHFDWLWPIIKQFSGTPENLKFYIDFFKCTLAKPLFAKKEISKNNKPQLFLFWNLEILSTPYFDLKFNFKNMNIVWIIFSFQNYNLSTGGPKVRYSILIYLCLS